ncbi:hypothetical protein V6Z11_A13G257700 [Gossypium hirsutum]
MQSRNEVADMVLMKILSKLESKSVIRFMNVCKCWRSSLPTPYFWTQHQHNGLKSNKLRLLIKRYHQSAHSKTTYFSELSTEKSEKFWVKRNIHIPYFENIKDQYSIHGQCNGLLEIKILPPPPLQLDPVYDVNFLNIGFDYKTNDYKVLRMRFRCLLVFLHEKFSTLLAPYHDCFLIHKWNFFDIYGSLGFIFRIDRRAKCNFEFWVMKESWSKVLNIESIYGVDYPMGFWKNGGLFFSGSNNELLLFDPNVGEFEGLDMHGST